MTRIHTSRYTYTSAHNKREMTISKAAWLYGRLKNHLRKISSYGMGLPPRRGFPKQGKATDYYPLAYRHADNRCWPIVIVWGVPKTKQEKLSFIEFLRAYNLEAK